MTLFLVRHGETEVNAAGRTLGKADPPLNEVGLRQAEAVARLLAKAPVRCLLSSPAIRAFQTAQVIGQVLQLEVDVAQELAERDLGPFDDMAIADLKSRRADMDHQFVDATQDWDGVASVESDEEVFRRTEYLLGRYMSPEGAVCAVTHAGVMKSFFHVVFHIDSRRLGVFKARNCSVAVFRSCPPVWNFEALLSPDYGLYP